MLQQKESHIQQKECNKIFTFGNMSCKLYNTAVIKQSENSYVETDNLINYPSQCKDNTISKVFELQFPHHTVVVHDQLTIFPNSQRPNPKQHSLQNKNNQSLHENSIQKDQNKKLILFRNSQNKESSQIKGDKKNIAKNVVTAFINYLRNGKKEGQNFDSQIQNLKDLIDKTKYNNQLIVHIVANLQLRHYFRIFLNLSAVQWVESSKLKNKQMAIDAIKVYRQLCEEKQQKVQRQNQKREKREPLINSDDQNQFLFQANINHQLEDQIKQFK